MAAKQSKTSPKAKSGKVTGSKSGTSSTAKKSAAAKSSPRKPASGRGKANKSKGKGGGGYRFALLAVVVLAMVVAALGVFTLQSYRADKVRQEVETVLGGLESTDVAMRVADSEDAGTILNRLRRIEERAEGHFRLGTVRQGRSELEAEAVLDRAPYNIRIYWGPYGGGEIIAEPGEYGVEAGVTKREFPLPQGPVLAIVIDDMGLDLEMAQNLLALDAPITLAVLPYLRHSAEIAELAGQERHPALLHMPMEPQSYPDDDPGEGAIFAADDPAGTPALVERALSEVPGVVGINNHMGSRATESAPHMREVMKVLAGHGLSFLDSVTSAHSVASNEARKAGIKWARRDIFLDNEKDVEKISEQIERAVKRAARNGTAIAIGHGYPQTLEALRLWEGRYKEYGVTVVPITGVLHAGG